MSTEESCVGEDLRELARSLGYGWPVDPDDKEGQWRLLKRMAQQAACWRKEVTEVRSEGYDRVIRERLYQHQQARLEATVRKLKNTRRALREYMSTQAAFVREGRAEILAARRAKSTE